MTCSFLFLLSALLSDIRRPVHVKWMAFRMCCVRQKLDLVEIVWFYALEYHWKSMNPALSFPYYFPDNKLEITFCETLIGNESVSFIWMEKTLVKTPIEVSYAWYWGSCAGQVTFLLNWLLLRQHFKCFCLLINAMELTGCHQAVFLSFHHIYRG